MGSICWSGLATSSRCCSDTLRHLYLKALLSLTLTLRYTNYLYTVAQYYSAGRVVSYLATVIFFYSRLMVRSSSSILPSFSSEASHPPRDNPTIDNSLPPTVCSPYSLQANSYFILPSSPSLFTSNTLAVLSLMQSIMHPF